MSIKIYNGFITDLRIIELLPKFKEVREEIVDIIYRGYGKDLVKESVLQFDKPDNNKTLKEIIEEKHDDIRKQSISLPSHIYISSGGIKSELDFSVFLFPYSDKTVVKIFGNDKEVIKKLTEVARLKEFDYWDNTDKPEDLYQEEWDTRYEIWKAVLSDFGPPIQNGLQYTFNPRELKMLHQISEYIKLEDAPSDDIRRKAIVREMEMLKEKELGNIQEVSDYIAFVENFQTRWETGDFNDIEVDLKPLSLE